MLRYAILGGLFYSVFLMAQTFLILFGRSKEPILRTFERYGEEIFYYPLVQLLVRIMAVAVCIELLIATITKVAPFILYGSGLLFILAAATHYLVQRSAALRSILAVLTAFPLWYHDVLSRTSRYERRRIGYLWYRLPARTRSTFNLSDELFIEWVDFVIMGAVMEEDALSVPAQDRAGWALSSILDLDPSESPAATLPYQR